MPTSFTIALVHGDCSLHCAMRFTFIKLAKDTLNIKGQVTSLLPWVGIIWSHLSVHPARKDKFHAQGILAYSLISWPTAPALLCESLQLHGCTRQTSMMCSQGRVPQQWKCSSRMSHKINAAHMALQPLLKQEMISNCEAI